MDVHISVIADFKSANPDIEVVDWCLSQHSWVMNRIIDVPEIIHQYSWNTIDETMIKQFQDIYDPFLKQFDGFITCHVPAFAMIYEKYNKPILMINSCRYDLPFCQTKNYRMLQVFKDSIMRMKDRIIIVSNNLGDREYTRRCTGITPLYNPSLCLYTNAKYTPTKDTFLCHSGSTPKHPLITQRSELGSRHEWSDVMSYKGIIHVPYEISTMSMFEQFTAGCPLFFPSKEFLKSNSSRLITIREYWGAKRQPFLSDINFWIDNSDMYIMFRSQNTYYYDSMEHLYALLKKFEYVDDSEIRQRHIQNVKDRWKNILHALFKN